MAKKRAIGRYPLAFRKMAVERLKGCDNIVGRSQELGVHRRLLYKWRDQLEPIADGEGPPANLRERELRQQVRQFKGLVAGKTLEADLLKGALQKSSSTPEQEQLLGAVAKPESFSFVGHRSVIGLNPLASAATQSPTLSIIPQEPLGSKP